MEKKVRDQGERGTKRLVWTNPGKSISLLCDCLCDSENVHPLDLLQDLVFASASSLP